MPRKKTLEIRCRGYKLLLAKRPRIMGVVNVTPDSFSDGGKFFSRDEAIKQAMRLAEQGADIIDIGGESSRPGARQISGQEEFQRIRDVVRVLVKKLSIPISIDTYKSEVAKLCLDLGASIINDITALRYDPCMAEIISRYKAAVVLMHMQGMPQTMQAQPRYKRLPDDIITELKKSITLARAAGIGNNRIIIDPGIGFGKTVEHNLAILRHLADFKALGYPLLIGVSRKSFIGKILNRDVGERLIGSIVSAVFAASQGADIVRVHDVSQTREALDMYMALAQD